MAFPQPLDRSEFEIAIICALQLEYDAVSLLFDENYNAEGDYYGRARGDTNSYATGRIGKYNTVLALLTEPGIINAASTTANVLVSYNGIRLALLVGICGGVPEGGPKGQMLLGDVVVSSSIVQYGSGKQYPQGFASKRDMAGDSSGQPNKDIRTLIKTLGTVYNLKALKARTAVLLRELQDKSRRDDLDVSYTYPGTSEDVLFPSSYRHKHHHLHALRCDCAKTHKDTDRVCDNALISTCVQLGCQRRRALPRPRLQERGKLETLGDPAAQNPAICFGAVASSDTVMKSAQHRDAIAAKTSVIAFEMEGAGVWVGVPCLVVKGVSDYADSHKGDKWQHFAAATAAAAAKAILEWYPRTDRASSWSSISSSSSPLSTTMTRQNTLASISNHSTHSRDTGKSSSSQETSSSPPDSPSSFHPAPFSPPTQCPPATAQYPSQTAQYHNPTNQYPSPPAQHSSPASQYSSPGTQYSAPMPNALGIVRMPQEGGTGTAPVHYQHQGYPPPVISGPLGASEPSPAFTNAWLQATQQLQQRPPQSTGSFFGGDQVNGDKFSGNKTVGDTIHGNKYTN